MNKISELRNGKGYFKLKLNSQELKSLRNIVNTHYLENLNQKYPEKKHIFANNKKIQNYHDIPTYINHKKIWPMKSRILPKKKVRVFLNFNFVKKLRKIFGNFKISDEYNIGHEEIYWRLVRPYQKKDVGPLHCDKWFWDLNKDFTPKGIVRVKCWISLWCKGLNGLRVYPKSQLKNFNYSYENRDGEKKPVFDLKDKRNKIKKLNCKPGTIIIFNDKLLHGGSINYSNQTRISIEFTMFVDRKFII